MSHYYFETNDFGISDGGIHLLRSRHNYDIIHFDKIGNLTIEKGKELNNWFILLLVGLGFQYTMQLSIMDEFKAFLETKPSTRILAK